MFFAYFVVCETLQSAQVAKIMSVFWRTFQPAIFFRPKTIEGTFILACGRTSPSLDFYTYLSEGKNLHQDYFWPSINLNVGLRISSLTPSFNLENLCAGPGKRNTSNIMEESRIRHSCSHTLLRLPRKILLAFCLAFCFLNISFPLSFIFLYSSAHISPESK